MTYTRKHDQSGDSVKKMLLSAVISIGIFLAASLIAAILASFFYKSSQDLGPFAFGALTISALCSGFINSGRGGFKQAALAALLVTLLMLMCGIVSTGGAIGGGAILNYICFFVLSAAGAYVRTKRVRRRRRRK